MSGLPEGKGSDAHLVVMLGAPAAMFGLLVLWFWLGYRWRSDS